MTSEPSGDYYDYTKTMKPERPWLVPWHQKYVYRIMHATRGGTGTRSADPVMAAGRPPGNRYVFGDGRIAELFLTLEDGLEVVKRVHHLTCGAPQIVLLTGWQFEGHDSKYPKSGLCEQDLASAGGLAGRQSGDPRPVVGRGTGTARCRPGCGRRGDAGRWQRRSAQDLCLQRSVTKSPVDCRFRPTALQGAE